MQDFEKYFNTARKAELDNVPFDKDNIESLLQQHREAGSQNFFKRIISKYGKLKMYSILSLITATMLTLSSMMFDSGENKPSVTAKNITVTIDEETDTINNFESNGETLSDVIKDVCEAKKEKEENSDQDEYADYISIGSSLKIHKDMLQKDEEGNYIIPMNRGVKEFDKLLTVSEVKQFAEKFQAENKGKFRDTTILIYNPLYSCQSKYLRWQHLVFDNSRWELNTSVPSIVKMNFSDTKSPKSKLEYSSVDIELDSEQDYFRLLSEIESNIATHVDIKLLKELCNVSLGEYYSKLEEITLKITDADIAKQAVLFANMNRKLIGNPFSEFKFKDEGLLLPKASLEKLGFKFYDNRFTYPLDETFTENSPKFFDDEAYDSDNQVFKNGVEEWFINNEGGKIDPKWGKNIRMMLSNTTERDANSDFLKEDHIKGYIQLSYPELIPARKNIPITPISKRNAYDFGLYLSSLKNSNVSNLKELYQLNSNYRDLQSILSEKGEKNISKEEKNELEMLKLIANNALHTLKYTKLIPIEIPVPYGVHTEEELASGDYSKITLWYYPDDNFLNALPDDMRNKIIKEMNLLESVVAGELPASDACQALDGEESLLGLCNLTDMAITDLTAAPNPTHGNCEISYTLTEERYTKVMLLDNSGRYVKDISNWQDQKAGEYSFNIDLSSLPKGNYNIAVFTNKNEKVMFKLMKK